MDNGLRGIIDQKMCLLCFGSVCKLLCVFLYFDFMSFLFCFVLGKGLSFKLLNFLKYSSIYPFKNIHLFIHSFILICYNGSHKAIFKKVYE